MSNRAEAGTGVHALMLRDDIQSRIYTIRGVQVMLDSDLADLYGVEIRVLNQQVKRNVGRFPAEFMFQLTAEEHSTLRSQNVTLKAGVSQTSQFVTIKKRRGQHRKYLPYAFTEQGVAMLSTVLRGDTAVRTSIQIMNAFVAMRRFIASNAAVFQRLDTLEVRQMDTDRKVEKVLNALESGVVRPKQGIFFEGQVFDAHKFVSDLFLSAKESIAIIDNFLDESVLVHLNKRKKGVRVVLLTRNVSDALALDVEKFNKQYPRIELRKFEQSHDRFIIIDQKDVYHFGASLKDLGKKWFAFSKMDIGAVEMLSRLEEMHA
ncbi:MAG: ORF6N domain-containing protein [Methanobacteriota archaeon]